MRRREFILAGGAAIASPLTVRAKTRLEQWRIGQVRSGNADQIGPSATALEQQLRDLAEDIGTNIVVRNRFVAPERIATEDAIEELLPNIDLLVIWGTLGAVAAKKLVSALPVVFVSVAAPVEMGFVESLRHPGGNMTGITFEGSTETYAKRLQILKEIVPSLSHVAVLGPKGDLNMGFAMSSLQKEAPVLGLTLVPFQIGSGDDLAQVFDGIKSNQVDGLISVAGNLMAVLGRQIAEMTLKYRLPSCHPFAEIVAAGGLIALGPDRVWMARQAAGYINKIIRGTPPSDLPVQEPDRYKLSVNMTTAKALGLTVPSPLLVSADEVIE
jgi:putative tryptophan/tyrosine transport system substrate-binding protein